MFLYTIEGKINVEDFSKVRNFGLTLKTNKLPVRYLLLNPFDIVAKRATSFDVGLYAKVLSEYEAERLKNPKTDVNNSWASGFGVRLLCQYIDDLSKK